MQLIRRSNFLSLLWIELVIFLGLWGSSQAQSDQCKNDTAALGADDSALAQLDPKNECLQQITLGVFDCTVNGSTFVDDYKEICEELGGKHFVGNITLNCEVLPGIIPNATEGLSFTWNVQNDNACLGASCTDADLASLLEEGRNALDGETGLSCNFTLGDGPSPGTVPTVDPSGSPPASPPSNLNDQPSPAPSPTSGTSTVACRLLMSAVVAAAAWIIFYS
jgi:hypothetical protein